MTARSVASPVDRRMWLASPPASLPPSFAELGAAAQFADREIDRDEFRTVCGTWARCLAALEVYEARRAVGA